LAAPILKDDLLIVNSMWTTFCYVGRTDLRTATCPPATSLQVISSAINVSPYRVTPAGGAVLLNVTDSSGGNPVTLRYSARSDASGQGTFTTLTHGFNPDTGKLDLVPGIWDGATEAATVQGRLQCHRTRGTTSWRSKSRMWR